MSANPEYRHRYYEEHADKEREAARRYREENLERERERVRRWRAEYPEQARKAYRALRAEAFAHYGERCATCGTADDLNLHHVNGDGVEHRERLGGGVLNEIRKQGWPSVLVTLCDPCHRAEHHD